MPACHLAKVSNVRTRTLHTMCPSLSSSVFTHPCDTEICGFWPERRNAKSTGEISGAGSTFSRLSKQYYPMTTTAMVRILNSFSVVRSD